MEHGTQLFYCHCNCLLFRLYIRREPKLKMPKNNFTIYRQNRLLSKPQLRRLDNCLLLKYAFQELPGTIISKSSFNDILAESGSTEHTCTRIIRDYKLTKTKIPRRYIRSTYVDSHIHSCCYSSTFQSASILFSESKDTPILYNFLLSAAKGSV